TRRSSDLAALAADGLAQHAVRLPHPRSVPEEQLEHAALLFRRRLLQPLLRGLLHVPLFCGSNLKLSIRYNHGVSPAKNVATGKAKGAWLISARKLAYRYAAA